MESKRCKILINPFSGTGERVQFARLTYKRLMSCEWVTYADVMADYLRLKSAEELPCPVSKCDHYGELKKAFPSVVEMIKKFPDFDNAPPFLRQQMRTLVFQAVSHYRECSLCRKVA